MDDNEERIGCLFIILIIYCIIFIVFCYSCFRLTRFKKCYDNNFKYPYCEKYKNY